MARKKIGAKCFLALGMVAGLSGALLCTTIASAEPAVVAPADFTAQLRVSDGQLGTVERSFSQIEAARTPAAKDALAAPFEAQQDAYAKSMLSQYSTALAQADLSMKSKGTKGSVQLVSSFERQAQSHERRLNALFARGQNLKPAGAASWTPIALPRAEEQETAFSMIGSFFIPQAKAAIALRVYNACHGNPVNQAACAQAIVAGVVDGNTARATYNACWSSKEGVRPKWWRAVLRAGCVTALVARLA